MQRCSQRLTVAGRDGLDDHATLARAFVDDQPRGCSDRHAQRVADDPIPRAEIGDEPREHEREDHRLDGGDRSTGQLASTRGERDPQRPEPDADEHEAAINTALALIGATSQLGTT